MSLRGSFLNPLIPNEHPCPFNMGAPPEDYYSLTLYSSPLEFLYYLNIPLLSLPITGVLSVS